MIAAAQLMLATTAEKSAHRSFINMMTAYSNARRLQQARKNKGYSIYRLIPQWRAMPPAARHAVAYVACRR
jgi:hypothetical protein